MQYMGYICESTAHPFDGAVELALQTNDRVKFTFQHRQYVLSVEDAKKRLPEMIERCQATIAELRTAEEQQILLRLQALSALVKQS